MFNTLFNTIQKNRKSLVAVELVFVSIFMLFSSFFAVPTPAHAAVLTRPANNLGLTGYWPFEDAGNATTTDHSGNGRHGVASGDDEGGGGGGGGGSISTPVALATFEGSANAGQSVNVSPSPNALVVVAIGQADNDNNDPVVVSVTSTFSVVGGSWTRLYDDPNVGGSAGAGVWYAQTTATPGTGRINYTTTDNARNAGVLFEVTGQDTTTPIPQFKIGGTASSAASLSLDSAPASDSIVIGVAAIHNPDEGAVAAPGVSGNFTEIAEKDSGGVTDGGVQVQYDPAPASQTSDWQSLSGNSRRLGVFEIAAQGSGGSSGGGSGTTTATTGRYGRAIEFNGVDSSLEMGNIGTVNTISFWIKTDDITSQKIINIDGTDQIETDSSGDITATSFPGTTTIYVDGSSSNQTLTPGTWHHVVITDTTGVSASTFEVGKVGTTYFSGVIDEVRTYNRVLTASEVQRLGGTGRVTIGGGYENRYSDGLVGYWSFDGNDINTSTGTVYDRSGGGNNGTIAGGTVHASDGRLGQSVHFPASESSSRVSIGSDSSIDDIFDGGGTIVAWIHPTGWGDNEGVGTAGSIFSKGGPTSGPWFAIFEPTESVVFAALHSSQIGQWSSPTNTISLGNWYHVAVSYDSSSPSNDATFYINGVAQATTELSTPSGTYQSDASASAQIGAFADTLYNFDGKIDELRVYNKILSPEEVKGLYNLGQAIIKSSTSNKLTSGLVGMWDFNGKSMDWANNEALDVSGNGKDGTLQNSPTPAVGVVGQSLRFNGTSTYIALPDLSVSEDRIFSYSAWVKSDTEQSGYILSEGRTTSIHSHGGLVYLDGLPRALWRNDAGTDSIVDGSTPINDGRWHHIVSVGNGSTLTLYVDGEVDGTPVAMSGAQTINVGAIGRLTRSTPGAYFLGQIDEVRVYDRALTLAEVRSLYAMGRGLANSGGGAVSGGDTNPPTRDPMTFAQTPTSVVNPGPAYQMYMDATLATDAEGSDPVEYYFTFHQCSTNGGTGGTDSGWQSSRVYEDAGLQLDKCYGYSVKARDAVGNETEESSIVLSKLPSQALVRLIVKLM